MNRYYISNDIKFIQGLGNYMGTPASATHFTAGDAQQFLRMHPDHILMTHGSNKKRSYVISSPQKFVGENNNIVHSIKEARVFYSPEDAYVVLDNEYGLADRFGEEAVVIDSNFKRYQRKGIKPKVVSSNSYYNTSKRIRIQRKIKDELIDSTSVCPICGLPISASDFTVDHIVPLSRGGTNIRTNLRVVCDSCNQLKGNFLDKELEKKVSSIGSNMLYHSPISDMSVSFARSIIRGTIQQYRLARE